MSRIIVGIDPGNTGAIVALQGNKIKSFNMPVTKIGKSTEIDFQGIQDLLAGELLYITAHFFVERAKPLAMGAKHAFNYGRGFAAIEIALLLAEVPVTYVEPTTWCKVMHEGISADFKPKVKSLVAVKRLYPKLVKQIPVNRNGKLHEGVVDALLIAGYGLRMISK